MTHEILIPAARKRLAILWFSYGGFLFLVVFAQTILGYYGDKTNEAWSWFLPSLFPTLSLIAAVFVSDATGKSADQANIDRFVYTLTIVLSLVYLIAVSLVIFIGPLARIDPIELMKLSNFGLGPMQGIVVACMGTFFIRKTKE